MAGLECRWSKIMKRKFTIAALAAAALTMTALPASADHNNRNGRPQEIVVRSDSGQRVLDPGQRMYWRVSGNPYKFKPGRIYEYDRCYRNGWCEVTVIDHFGRQHFNTIVAPRPPWERHDGYRRGWRH